MAFHDHVVLRRRTKKQMGRAFRRAQCHLVLAIVHLVAFAAYKHNPDVQRMNRKGEEIVYRGKGRPNVSVSIVPNKGERRLKGGGWAKTNTVQ